MSFIAIDCSKNVLLCLVEVEEGNVTDNDHGFLFTGCIAISHPHRLTGYKNPQSETNLRIIGAETSYKFFHELTSGLPSLQKPTAKLVCATFK